MKSISTLSMINRRVLITLDGLTLNSIKHIVSIAPQEAQWFHTVTPISSSPALVHLKLSSKLYIPKQNTSLAEVNSTSSMMIDFYNDLKEDHLTQNEINKTLSSMNCWCHSHHNMVVEPSLQDLKQFEFFINSSLQQKQNNWQIMLIFNKHDQFYSRVYDPETGIIFEGVEIVETNNYDFSYIDKAAKHKFLRPQIKTPSLFGKYTHSSLTENDSAQQTLCSLDAEDFDVALINAALSYSFKDPRSQDSYSFSEEGAELFLNYIQSHLIEQEYAWFLMLLTGSKKSIPKCFTTSAFKKYSINISEMTEDVILEMTEVFSLEIFQEALHHVFEISELSRVKDVQDYIKAVQL